ncbi:MAG TPA: hypothetical protein VE547_16880 [Mycobacteriales bacterium]|nr:hypothetical protein [Mycobacteriales bacterium]
MTEYAAPPGYQVVAPDWDRELRRPVLLRCGRCAGLVLGGGDTARHDEWHRELAAGLSALPAPRAAQ